MRLTVWIMATLPVVVNSGRAGPCSLDVIQDTAVMHGRCRSFDRTSSLTLSWSPGRSLLDRPGHQFIIIRKSARLFKVGSYMVTKTGYCLPGRHIILSGMCADHKSARQLASQTLDWSLICAASQAQACHNAHATSHILRADHMKSHSADASL